MQHTWSTQIEPAPEPELALAPVPASLRAPGFEMGVGGACVQGFCAPLETDSSAQGLLNRCYRGTVEVLSQYAHNSHAALEAILGSH